jgi:hypothetical protein
MTRAADAEPRLGGRLPPEKMAALGAILLLAGLFLVRTWIPPVHPLEGRPEVVDLKALQGQPGPSFSGCFLEPDHAWISGLFRYQVGSVHFTSVRLKGWVQKISSFPGSQLEIRASVGKDPWGKVIVDKSGIFVGSFSGSAASTEEPKTFTLESTLMKKIPGDGRDLSFVLLELRFDP